MTSYLVTIATVSHQTYVKMCLRDIHTVTENPCWEVEWWLRREGLKIGLHFSRSEGTKMHAAGARPHMKKDGTEVRHHSKGMMTGNKKEGKFY